MVSLKDVLSHHSSDDDLYITRSHMKWQAEGRRYTEAAVERVLEVMHHDFLTADRGDGKGRVRASMLNDPCLRKQQLSFIGERAARRRAPCSRSSISARSLITGGSWPV